jgi:hexosaminidase
MKKAFLFFFSLLLLRPGYSQDQTEISIIPQPASLERTGQSFELKPSARILTDIKNAELNAIASRFAKELQKSTGFTIPVQATGSDRSNSVVLVLEDISGLGAEGYRLEVNANTILIRASKPAGIFYGLMTLKQLFPKEIESSTVLRRDAWIVPGVTINDVPRFSWRGLMFDVSRHFFTKDQVKKFIDDMVRYKYNLLHLHLTDDQGWRIEIKSLPKLTEVGAWNVNKTGSFNTFSEPEPNEPRNFGGFFTHEDLKEIIQYAKDRYVNILPEIDVPGHSMAAVASYPELSCTPGSYRVNSGEKFMQWTDTGFFALTDNTLCPANEKVYEFLDKVFTEVAQIFPFEYIHMGGDECAKNFWEKSDAVKQLMKKEKLKDMHEVQSYFVKRVSKIVESKGKKLIGWDEILEGGLPPKAVVMSWRGIKGGIEAAKQGHEVVMSPSTHVYIDLMQGDGIIEPPVYSSVLLNKSYQFEPVPEGVDPKYVKGGQANLWTEQVYNTRHQQYMTWPRAFAVSESLWSPREKKNWKNFVERVEKHFERFDIASIKYAPSMYDPVFSARKDASGKLFVELSLQLDDLDVYYSFDNSFPDQFYPKYTKALEVPKDASRLKVITYRNGKRVGRDIEMPVAELLKRAARKKT